ncbi:TPA: hypothetical protein DCG61_01560 [Patescibacteria group bacterium]|mgnify:CR=1 FL=1|jgi:cyclopropane fatty-acyl-phospholipid synthase-like methyltransferase|nr:hypothetical protein [Patescibacteria group bacterium]
MKNKLDLYNINSIRPFVRNILKYKKSGSVLDLGSAAGRHSLFLAKKGFTVTAVEISSEFTAALKEIVRLQKLKVKVVIGDVTKFTPKKKYDVIISTMVLHFLPYQIQSKQIELMQSNTKRNGLNVISSYSDKNKDGIRPYPLMKDKIKDAYEGAGWKILHHHVGRGTHVIDPRTGKKGSGFWKEELIAQKV